MTPLRNLLARARDLTDDLATFERASERAVHRVDQIDTLDEWRAEARQLEGVLRSAELQRPILGIQRRLEARIGQLLDVEDDQRPGARHDPGAR